MADTGALSGELGYETRRPMEVEWVNRHPSRKINLLFDPTVTTVTGVPSLRLIPPYDQRRLGIDEREFESPSSSFIRFRLRVLNSRMAF